MGLRRRLQKLERDASDRLAFIDLPDGSSFFFDPAATHAELFLYAANSIRAQRQGEEQPPIPEVLRVAASLPTRSEREKAFWLAYGDVRTPFVNFDVGRFFESGEIAPREQRSKQEHDHGQPEEADNVIVVQPSRSYPE